MNFTLHFKRCWHEDCKQHSHFHSVVERWKCVDVKSVSWDSFLFLALWQSNWDSVENVTKERKQSSKHFRKHEFHFFFSVSSFYLKMKILSCLSGFQPIYKKVGTDQIMRCCESAHTMLSVIMLWYVKSNLGIGSGFLVPSAYPWFPMNPGEWGIVKMSPGASTILEMKRKTFLKGS